MKKKTLEIAAAVERDSALAGWSLVAKYSGLIFNLRKQLAARDAAIEKLQDDACEEVAALREKVSVLEGMLAANEGDLTEADANIRQVMLDEWK